MDAQPRIDAYGVLAREHRLIERTLEALGRIGDDARRNRRLNGPAVALVIRFLREYVDGVHHAKEERVVFPQIAAQGHFPGCGLIPEHEEGRERVHRMAEAARQAADGDEQAVMRFVRTARSFISFLREHIAKEDECLADVVNATFAADAHERLVQQFDEVERRAAGQGALARFTAIVYELEAQYPPPPPVERAPT